MAANAWHFTPRQFKPAGELRSLTRGRLFLDSNPPYIVCKSGNTKNRKDSRQYIQDDLAAELREHLTSKTPKAKAFAMPYENDVAKMIRMDLAIARKMWLDAAKDSPHERLQREQSDFLAKENHEGEVFDFHSLRHTCSAWLAFTPRWLKPSCAIRRLC